MRSNNIACVSFGFPVWHHGGVNVECPAPERRRQRGMVSSIMFAVLLGVVDALGWERPGAKMVEVADAPQGGPGPDLDYRHLDPLD
jgi:hypothetical protein